MTTELDSIDAELFALRTEAEQGVGAARDRVFSRLAHSVPGLASAAVGAVVASDIASAARSNAAGLAVPGKLWLLGMLVLGGAVGAGTFAALDREPETRVVYVDRVVPAPAAKVVESVPAPTKASVSGPDSPPAGRSTRVAPVVSKAATARVEAERAVTPSRAVITLESTLPSAEGADIVNLAEQQTLLDKARLALRKGDGQAALEILDLHARRHPASVLTEEREALTIKALASLGRSDEARSRFELFAKRFSRSPLLPSLELATGVTETTR